MSSPQSEYDELTAPGFLKSRSKKTKSTSNISFAKNLAFGPATLAILAPIAFLSQTMVQLKNKFSPEPVPASSKEEALDFTSIVANDKSEVLPKETRKYDMILLGATGFTGQLSAEYLARNYEGDVKWAIAGRSQAKLDDVIAKLQKLVPGFKGVDTIVCDTGNILSVHEMCKSTAVIATTAGPFSKIGNSIVACAASTNTDYVDITGETDWVRKNITLHNKTAQASGARIVSLCGHDSIPWDLSTQQIAKAMNDAGDELAEVNFFDEIQGAPSGGTVATMLYIIEGANKKAAGGKPKGDPFYLLENGEYTKFKTKNLSPMGLPVNVEGRWMSPFVMSACNADAAKRSAALRPNGNSMLKYREGELAMDWKTAFVSTTQLFVGLSVLLIPPLRNQLMKMNQIPNPGQGPSVNAMKNGYLRITGHGTGAKGTKVSSCIYFDVDAGYRDTARMLVESGLTLAKHSKDIHQGGGVFTPGFALGDTLLKRLVATGTRFGIKTLGK